MSRSHVHVAVTLLRVQTAPPERVVVVATPESLAADDEDERP